MEQTRALTVIPDHEVLRLGARINEALGKMPEFAHANQDGSLFAIRYSDCVNYGDRWAAYYVDTGALWHVRAGDLAKPQVAEHLTAVLHRRVLSQLNTDLVFAVELQKRPRFRFPDKVMLDLEQRPQLDLPVPLGVGRSGPVWAELTDIGHALVVGTSGAGKSNWVHAALASLLTSVGPDRLRLVLVDPKRSEFTAWGKVPHLIGHVANTSGEFETVLADLASEIERRGDMMAAVLARDLKGYNKRVAHPLPYILVCADELLDFSGQRDAMDDLKVIARRGRSAGVILWGLVQNTAALDGLPRIINVNMGARFVFRVRDNIGASNAGCPGAENIARDTPGRMLALVDGPVQELQAYYLDDEALLQVAGGLSGGQVEPVADVQPEELEHTEAELVRYACGSLEGFFPVNRIAAAFKHDGWTNHKVDQLARKWEKKGWLEKRQGTNDGRRVTTQLAQMAGTELDG